MMNKPFYLAAVITSTLLLSACGTTGQSGVTTSASNATSGSKIDNAISTALSEAEQSGNKQEVLAILQQSHKRDPQNVDLAVKYAKALREDDQINVAKRILTPFTGKDSTHSDALTEMAMTQISLGDYSNAEQTAARALEINSKSGRAYLAMGTAQDAQEKHGDAEISFREGLKYQKGDSASILNNLSLNLASQGHLKESLSILTKARKLYPKRMEIERNYRIIKTLQEDAAAQLAPPPNKKPTA